MWQEKNLLYRYSKNKRVKICILLFTIEGLEQSWYKVTYRNLRNVTYILKHIFATILQLCCIYSFK